jgi:hypothetical protein
MSTFLQIVLQIVLQTIGTLLVLVALIDIYLTVLHPRAESSLLSRAIAQGTWRLFRMVGQHIRHREKLFSYVGPSIVVIVVSVWVLLLLFGFAAMIWPVLGTAIQVEQGETPTDFIAALYYAGYALSTLGTGDLLPQNATYRLLIVLKSILGFAVFTLTLSFVTSVYSSLTSRNTFALNLHHRTADTADSAELLARLAADNNLNSLNQDISDMAQHLIHLLESNNSYPVLFYFRYRQAYYAMPRILYLTLDTATLIRSALEPSQYRSITHSSGTAALWYGGNQILEELCQTLVPNVRVQAGDLDETRWRSHYHQALDRLKSEGIAITDNPQIGADAYVTLRHRWALNLAKLIHYMDYEPDSIFPCEYYEHS